MESDISAIQQRGTHDEREVYLLYETMQIYQPLYKNIKCGAPL